MLRGVFVTGTDTGVGKTVVSAALFHRYRTAIGLRYWKPVQTGIEQDDDTATVAELGRCTPDELFMSGVRLERPLSPHLSARLSGRTIALPPLVECANAESSPARFIVEGAGGALVPINDDELMTDLMARLRLPAVVVARSTLGTINHTMLTIEALRRRRIEIAGIVMVGDRDADNREAIERYGRVAVVGEMPRFDPLTSDTLSAWAAAHLDRDGRLLELLK